MTLEIRHLQLLTAIHEAGTVTKAAGRLNLTQSAVSHQLRGIEDKLGITLFQRSGKKMLITPAGERLFDTASSVLAELKRAEQELFENGTPSDGVVRISTECYTCYHWLPTRLRQFRDEFPRVQVRIVAEATRRPLQALLDGKLDVAIVSDHVRNARISYQPLFKDELVVIMSPANKLACNRFVRAEDFFDAHLIAYSVPREQLTVFQSVLQPAGVTPRSVSHVELTEAIVEMVKADLGVGVVARWAVEPHVRAGTLVALPLTKKGFRRDWSAATIRRRSNPDYLRRFLSLLSGNFDSRP
jgi:LysR family transcriptional regulator, regulator for metE and metH